MPKDVSIEYAHIYTNQQISKEHRTSIDVLSRLRSSLEAEDSASLLVVMVDDYSFPDPTFDYESFINWLDEHGQKPDLMIRESQLIPVCDQVISLMNDVVLREQITDYIKNKKYPCSLFIAAWYLLRLGKIKSSIFPGNLVADRLVNILPESFKPYEDKGLNIIASTPYADCTDLIDYKFLPGRLIA